MTNKTDNQKALHKSLATKIGVGLAAARKCKGLTQQELAERIGVEIETVSRFERGATMPSLVTLQMLAVELDTTMADIVGESSSMPNDQARVISALLSDLKLDDRALVMGMIQDLCARLQKS